VAGILGFAFLVRWVALLSLKDSLYFDFMLWDERIYHLWATEIAEGTYNPTRVYSFAPLPAYVMAWVYKLFSPDVYYIRVLNIIFGCLTCLVAYFIGRELKDERTGLLACMVSALYKPFIFYSIVPLKTALGVFLFGLPVAFLLSHLNRPHPLKLLFAGISLGLVLTVRENALVLVPIVFLILAGEGYRSRWGLARTGSMLAVYCAGLALATAPFAIRNHRLSGDFVLTSSQAGFNLYIGNSWENDVPFYRPLPFASSSPFLQETHFVIEASRRSGKRLTPQEASSYWVKETVRTAVERPKEFFLKMFRKSLVLVNHFEQGHHYHIPFMSRFVPFFKLPFFGIGLILPLGVAAMAVLSVRSRGVRYIALLGLVYCSTLVVFFSSTQYRLPLLTLLIPCAVLGLEHAVAAFARKDKRLLRWYLGVFAAFVVIAFLPVHGTDDVTAFYNTHAIVLNDNKQPAEARKYLLASSKMQKPYSAFANLQIAGPYLRAGEPERAMAYLEKIPDSSFAAAGKYDLIAAARIAQKRWDEAIAAYERSIQINSGSKSARQALIRLLDKRDPERAKKEFEAYQYINSFYE